MIYAQINNNKIKNTITLQDSELESIFSEGFDYFIRIDELDPIPSINWIYNGETFSPPQQSSLTTTEIVTVKIQAAMKFGNELVLTTAVENVLLGITQYGKTKEVSDYCTKLQLYLSTGSLYAAIDEINYLIGEGIPENLSPFITENKLNIAKSKISTFLGI